MEQCNCTICREGRFPQTESEVEEFERAHKGDPVPPWEWFEDQRQQIQLLIEIRRLLS